MNNEQNTLTLTCMNSRRKIETMTKKLYRSRTNKMIAGVCAGLGDFFELDPTLIRLGMVVLVLAAGVGVLAYIVAWIIVPQQPWESVGK